ncbi:serine/threonine protein kinase [Denitromonas ohlonensis]|jgi:serine/threonine protein kinase|uniref:Serine/threonine protein kinase n=2 Tax=Denitromonas TaxID=139331 RepID=A0A557SB85_9RHOO|nr:serine/threonine-protein kinase [Denitromonas ohlonensis]TVT51072.1 MAG: serine/threonine protein kinase [Denitromonas halophila]TVO68397.1 serine/threonine protein kinase [Denitromonas ohlonensis]TVO74675.1 serine/threonine protein kinase [Denitromonas ohlonensis]TVT71222.1 MAG: serine/threonine protein kinase [Denitromonas halophila]TVT71766.1 MAG: serine/threonine protein kinase [Denitromonas halophila]
MPPQVNQALPSGFQLDQYRIERQLSLGGFSIVYLAYDAEGTPVAIKEYLPNSLALRGEGEVEPIISAENEPAFRYGMKCFFEEGRALAKLMHPNVVRVLNFFRANNTVYMVMQFERGRTLHEYVNKHRDVLRERFLRGVFTRMLNGLREVHAHKLLHLDIKPSNIYLRLDGTPVLLDFGAARQTLMTGQPMLKPMYTPGFASPEQFAGREHLGPWSDIYSVGASMYACLAGSAPPRSDERTTKDTYTPAAKAFAGRHSEQLLDIIDWCLHLDPLARPQSVYALQKALVQRGPDEAMPASWFSDVGSRLKTFIGRS